MTQYQWKIVAGLVLAVQLAGQDRPFSAEPQDRFIRKQAQKPNVSSSQTLRPLVNAETPKPAQKRLTGKRTSKPADTAATTPPQPVSRNYAALKIIPHPSGGMYVGQYEWVEGDIATFEAAGGRKTALWSKHRGSWGNGYDSSGHPHFDVQAANRAWQEGKIILVQMYNTTPTPGESEAPSGFTVDKLLSGQYDSELGRFASELRQFGKPMFFTAGREPNGVEAAYFGGFGPAGDKSLLWALENKRGLADFDPSRMPYSARLYGGIGNPQVCDGVERLKAAQRYYHDFFVRREGLNFLTFDTMGWAAKQLNQLDYDIADLPAHVDKSYAKTLMTSCHDFRNFYPGSDYVDWVSLNFYMLDYYAKDLPGLTRDYVVSVDEHMRALDKLMSEVKQVASGKPVFFMELGFPDGINQSSRWAAEKIRTGFPRILASYPQIQGFAMWSSHPSWMSYFPWDCLIRPNTEQGTALKAMFAANPSKFHSCVYLSDGRLQPNCVE